MAAESKEKKERSSFLKTDGGKTKSNIFDISFFSLPKGEGSIRGIDEKFSVNTFNAKAAFSIALPFPPKRRPSSTLSFYYKPRPKNGIFGLSWWSLRLPSIEQEASKQLL